MASLPVVPVGAQSSSKFLHITIFGPKLADGTVWLIDLFTAGEVFTVYSSHGNETRVVCLKLSFETNFLELELLLHEE